jgi:hypothetical protein
MWTTCFNRWVRCRVPKDQRRTAAAGFDHHFVKPIDFATLSNLLSALSSNGRLELHAAKEA